MRRSEQNQAIPRNLTRKLDGLFARWWLSFCSAEAVSPLRSATHPATKVRASRPLRPCAAPIVWNSSTLAIVVDFGLKKKNSHE